MKGKLILRMSQLDQASVATPEEQSTLKHTNSKQGDVSTVLAALKSSVEGLAGQIEQQRVSKLMEPRDIRIEIVLPQLPSVSPNYAKSLEQWTGTLCRQVFSIAFQQYSQGKLNFDQSKIFCCENILRNLVRLSQRDSLTASAFSTIDSYIQNSVLRYMLAKYPTAESEETSGQLDRHIRQIYSDSQGFLNSERVRFSIRAHGNYNDLILRVVNLGIGAADRIASKEKERKTAFEMFERYIKGVIDDVQEGRKTKKQQISNKKHSILKIERKIPSKVPLYSLKQIQSQHFVVKNRSILSILVKWCEQLWSKFNKGHFLSPKQAQLCCQNRGIVNSVSFVLRQSLDNLLAEEKAKISSFLSDLSTNNYEMQSCLLIGEMRENVVEWGDELESLAGGFAAKVISNLHNFIISYLNRLIHGLLTVSARWLEINRSVLPAVQWATPPQLFTLTIDDLFRCDYTSNQHDILALYERLTRLSRQNPEELRIIQLQNRLKQTSGDVVLKMRLFERDMCEFKLVMQSRKSKWQQHSSKFNSFFSMLKVAQFGPIAELCNEWNTIEPRTALFRQNTHSNSQQERHTCEFTSKSAAFQPQDRSFICSVCKSPYSHNNFIRRHIKCSLCPYWICARCQIDRESDDTLLQSLLFDEEERQVCWRIKKNEKLPEYGFCVLKESRIARCEFFRSVDRLGKQYLLSQRQGQVYEVCAVETPQTVLSFLSNYILFSVLSQLDHERVGLSSASIQQYLLRKEVLNVYDSQGDALGLQHSDLNDQICELILEGDGTKVKSIDLEANQLRKIDFLAHLLPQLTTLQLNSNSIQDFTHLDRFSQLQRLHLAGNELTTIPSQISSLSKLQLLDLHSNQLKQVPDLSSLINLTRLDLSSNYLTSLSSSLSCLNLQYINFSSNCIRYFPDQVCKMLNLRYLLLSNNSIERISDKIELLAVLQELDMAGNRLLECPDGLGKLKKLRSLSLCGNELMSLPEHLEWKALELLQLSDNKLTILPETLFLSSKLSKFDASHNNLTVLSPQINKLQQLTSLDLSFNNLSSLPDSILALSSLAFFSLTNNQLTSLPVRLNKLLNLQSLYASANRIQSLPAHIKGCLSLRQLELEDNALEIIPNFIGMLDNLEEDRLDFSNNPIKSIECVDFVLKRGNEATRKMVRDLVQVGETEEEGVKARRVVRMKKSSQYRRGEALQVSAKPVTKQIPLSTHPEYHIQSFSV